MKGLKERFEDRFGIEELPFDLEDFITAEVNRAVKENNEWWKKKLRDKEWLQQQIDSQSTSS